MANITHKENTNANLKNIFTLSRKTKISLENNNSR